MRESDGAKAARADAVAKAVATSTPEERSERARRAWQREETRARILAGIERRSQDPDWQASPQFRRGADHAAYKGTKKNERAIANSRYAQRKWRTAVFKRDNRTCQECGTTAGLMHTHHIKPWSTHPELRYELSNGLTLCAECHRKIPKPTTAT